MSGKATAAAVGVIALLSLSATSAGAKTSTACNLVVDAPGDANAPETDIVSADIASNKQDVTAVIRLSGTPSDTVTSPTGGRRYIFTFAVPGQATDSYLSYLETVTGNEATAGTWDGKTYTDTSGGSATASVDPGKKEVRISAPLQSFTGFKWTAQLKRLHAATIDVTGFVDPPAAPIHGSFTSTKASDDAMSSKTYTGNTPSCVKPGI